MNTKVNSVEKSVALSVEIDSLTECLVHRLSGEMYETEMDRLDRKEELVDHWSFDWKRYLDQDGFEIYKLTVKGDAAIQGLI